MRRSVTCSVGLGNKKWALIHEALSSCIPLLCYSSRPRVLFSPTSNRVILPAHETLAVALRNVPNETEKA
jgi:hypothetical protein